MRQASKRVPDSDEATSDEDQGAWPHRAAPAARPCRRGDRVKRREFIVRFC